ncbi:MAG: tripartite tricarboxylate transporter substrate binding protein [Alphaproteobacteria bacterium]|nr:tripartite tricarboxylate transporter substrate binding protein [Alphaproteobacteria bacterium]
MKNWICVLALLGCLSAVTSAQAQTYPARPINLVVTAAAGGVTDVVARAFGQKLTEAWGQQVIVENKGGAAHVTGATSVARAAPDGYTLLVAEAGTFSINPAIYLRGKLTYDEKTDFIPITGLVRINQALLASNSLPVSNVKELIELAKKKPGELTFGTAGVGSAPHMNIELLQYMTGIKLVPVHYRGAAPALTDVMAGHINLMSVSASLALPPHRAGQIKILGIGSEKRMSVAADIPTVAETGLPGYEATTWFGLFAPAGTPRDVVMKLNAEAKKVFSDPVFEEKFMAPQMFQSLVMAQEHFDTFIKAEIQKWSKVIQAAKIKIE